MFVIQVFMALAVLAFFFWLLMGGTSQSKHQPGAGQDELIDPNDARQLATLIGMAGGDIADVAIARFAIERFQKEHGRAPTTRDIGILIGLMRNF